MPNNNQEKSIGRKIIIVLVALFVLQFIFGLVFSLLIYFGVIDSKILLPVYKDFVIRQQNNNTEPTNNKIFCDKTDPQYCQRDDDCMCEQDAGCFVGNKKYYDKCVDKTGRCFDVCEGWGQSSAKCIDNKCTIMYGVINSRDQVCQNDNDCVLVMTECSCDCGAPVNKKYQEKYLKAQNKKCKSYTGPYCKMKCPLSLKCVNNICVN